MSESTFELVIATPEQVLFEGEAVQLILRTSAGDIAFLASHGPFIGRVETCIGSFVDAAGERREIVIDGGLVRAGANRVSLLATDAEFASDVEQESLRRRQERLEQEREDLDDATVEAYLRGIEVRSRLVS